MLFQCSECPSSFSFKKNLYQHLRRKHNVSPQLEGKNLCPLQCEGRFRTHRELRQHLQDVHHQTLESENHDFLDSKAFEVWKKRLEEVSGFGYVRRISEKVLQGGEAKTYYICHRSGTYRTKATGQRQVKKVGTNKIGTTCPSVMEVTRFPSDGAIKVLFWKKHFGHVADEKKPPRRKPRRTKRMGELIPFEVCAVLPAAGTGERMGLGIPKQYVPLHQKPLVCYTAEAFLRLPFIKKVVVVASSDSLELMLRTLSESCVLQGDKLMVTEGSGSRHESIRSGLRALQTCCEVRPEVVVVHDGVRPFISDDIICDVVLAAKEHKAAGITCPLVSTVISVDPDGFLDSSLDRSKYKASEMPQAFDYDLICKAYEKSSAYDLEFGTECLHLVQKYTDIKAKLLPGTSHLWKVTHHKDIYTAAAVVKETQSVGIISSSAWSSLSSVLGKRLSQTFEGVHSVGKLSEASIGQFPNLVQIQEDSNPYNVIERLDVLAQRSKLTQLTTLVQVFVSNFDDTLNFLEFQKQARCCAKSLRSVNMLVYFVLHTAGSTEPCEEELAELVQSLLFDSNPNISGSVFLS